MTEANKTVENSTETAEEQLATTELPSLETIEKFYRENYGLGLPDLSLSLTEGGLGEAISDLLYKHGMIPEGKELSSFVFPVDFSRQKSLPLVIWLQDEELAEEQLELPLEKPTPLTAGKPKFLN